MKNPFKSNLLSKYLMDRVFVFSIDDEGMIEIKELKNDALIILPEQIPEIVQNKDLINDNLAKQILLAFDKR